MATIKYDERFEGWDAYVKRLNLPHLTEIVSIDSHCALGESRLTSDETADIAPANEVGPHPVCFRTLECLQGCLVRIAPTVPFNLLCVFREPDEPPVSPQPSFVLLGCDLIEDRTGISAVTNCGRQFSAVIGAADVNAHGLINTFERAKAIQRELLRVYPQDPHANCSLWAMFRARPR
jgi:hypothetical protein